MNNTTNDKLDAILSFLNSKEKIRIYFLNVRNLIEMEKNIFGEEYDQLLGTLIKDGYAEPTTDLNNEIRITTNGKLFIEKGGYSRSFLELRISKFSNIAIKSITITTLVIGSIWTIIQINKYFHCICDCSF